MPLHEYTGVTPNAFVYLQRDRSTSRQTERQTERQRERERESGMPQAHDVYLQTGGDDDNDDDDDGGDDDQDEGKHEHFCATRP